MQNLLFSKYSKLRLKNIHLFTYYNLLQVKSLKGAFKTQCDSIKYIILKLIPIIIFIFRRLIYKLMNLD
jgi:hypothetical protein